MFYFIIVITLVLYFFGKLNNRVRSPYTCTHVIGKIGSGKTTYLVYLMKRDIKKGWTVFTDIPDIHLKGVYPISVSQLENFIPPPHSSVYIDEAGLSLDNRKFKTFPDGLRDFFALMRHYRVKVTLTSQHVDIDAKVARRLTNMAVVTNLGLFSLVRPVSIKFCITEPNAEAESRIAFKLKFDGFTHWKLIFLPSYWAAFDSFHVPYRRQVPIVDNGSITDISYLGVFTKNGLFVRWLKDNFQKVYLRFIVLQAKIISFIHRKK